MWALGCLLYAIMYRESPFEFNLEETGGSLALAVLSGRIRWPEEGPLAYPDTLHQLVLFMLQACALLNAVIKRLKPSLQDWSCLGKAQDILKIAASCLKLYCFEVSWATVFDRLVSSMFCHAARTICDYQPKYVFLSLVHFLHSACD